MIATIVQELELQRNYLQGEDINTIYLGGGTPSLLDERDLEQIFTKIYDLHTVSADAEITLEANPDDLNKKKLAILKDSRVNRLSIGIQSFSEKDLQYMNRAHNATESRQCIEDALAFGFDNLTVDLIYGTPTTSHQEWQQNMQTIFDYKIPHISCYCLTVEPNTALDHFVKKGKSPAVDEEQAAQQFELLLQAIEANGYEQYEISNFAKLNHHARHNSNYWLGNSYLGIGPSAHSFNGTSRQWNVANNAQYMKAIQSENKPFEVEILTPEQRYNEYIMTALRTKWGCDLAKIGAINSGFEKHFAKAVQVFIDNKTVSQKDQTFYLTKAGKLLADNITMELFISND